MKIEHFFGLAFFLILFTSTNTNKESNHKIAKTNDLITCKDDVTKCKATHTCCPSEDSYGW